jgi:hypothetical protein
LAYFDVGGVFHGGGTDRRLRKARDASLFEARASLPLRCLAGLLRARWLAAGERSSSIRAMNPWAIASGVITVDQALVRWQPRGSIIESSFREAAIPLGEVDDIEAGRYSLRKSWVLLRSGDSVVTLLVRPHHAAMLRDHFSCMSSR